MARPLMVFCVYLFQIVSCQIVFEDSCATLDNSPGMCVNIRLCELYIKILKNFGSTPDVQDTLRKTFCGFDGTTPKVCCPRQFIQSIIAASSSVNDTGRTLTTTETEYISEFPSPPECGISNASFGRIVGGVDAKLGDLPWMALLGYKAESLINWRCGGSLASPRHVITAAHCIHNHETSLYVVRLGELDLEREDDGATPVDVLIKRMTKHEQYNPTSYENDIGLIVLQNDVQFSELVKPICIPRDDRMRSMDFVDWTPLVAGWGRLSAQGPKATHLQVLQVPVLSAAACRDSYSAYGDQVVDERVMCAGYSAGGKDSCQGDSGGPLMQPISIDYPLNLTSVYYQIGVVSFGPRECARPGLPGIYTRVTSYIPWLERHMLGSSKQ